MVDATQVQIRRGTEGQIANFVPVEGEVICDLTHDTLRVGDGSKIGGHMMPNVEGLQSGKHLFAVAGGSANAIVLNLNPPVVNLVTGMEFRFLATSNNTGAVTVNLNGFGAIQLRKIQVGNAVQLVTNDLFSGVVYTVIYDGTYFVLLSGAGGDSVAPAAGLDYDLYRAQVTGTSNQSNSASAQGTDSYTGLSNINVLGRSWAFHAHRTGIVTVSFEHARAGADGAYSVMARVVINSTQLIEWATNGTSFVFRQYDVAIQPGDIIIVQQRTSVAGTGLRAVIRNLKLTSSTPAYGAISG